MGDRVRYDRKKGRVEVGLENELVERKDIRPAERAALRVQAHAVDLAEAARDPDLITTANAGYLQLRSAAGLTAGGAKPVDAFDALLADLARPTTSSGDPAQR